MASRRAVSSLVQEGSLVGIVSVVGAICQAGIISLAGTRRYCASDRSPGGHRSSLSCDWGTAGARFSILGQLAGLESLLTWEDVEDDDHFYGLRWRCSEFLTCRSYTELASSHG